MSNETRYEVNKPDVVDESVDGEVLIVHLGTGSYYSSRGSGDLAWQMLSNGAIPAEVAAAFGAEATAQAGVERFLAHLVEEGLLRPRLEGERTEVQFPAAPLYSDPVLDKYTDMQELLLLDPIHDVEEEGWPKARPAAGA